MPNTHTDRDRQRQRQREESNESLIESQLSRKWRSAQCSTSIMNKDGGSQTDRQTYYHVLNRWTHRPPFSLPPPFTTSFTISFTSLLSLLLLPSLPCSYICVVLKWAPCTHSHKLTHTHSLTLTHSHTHYLNGRWLESKYLVSWSLSVSVQIDEDVNVVAVDQLCRLNELQVRDVLPII